MIRFLSEYQSSRTLLGTGLAADHSTTPSYWDDDEPIFSQTPEHKEVRSEDKIERTWGLGPVGVRMRVRMRSLSPDNFAFAGSSGASSSSSPKWVRSNPVAAVGDAREAEVIFRQHHSCDQGEYFVRRGNSVTSRAALPTRNTSSRDVFAEPVAPVMVEKQKLRPTPNSSSHDMFTKPVEEKQKLRHEIHELQQQTNLMGGHRAGGGEHVLPKRGCLRRAGQQKRLVKSVSWSRRVVAEKVPITPYKNSEDGIDLWYSRYNIECNKCHSVQPSDNYGNFAGTFKRTLGGPRFAQWEIVCADCITKDRLTEIGGLQILSYSVDDGSKLRQCMHKMVQVMANNAPINKNGDTITHLLRSLRKAGINLESFAGNTNEDDVRRSILGNAVSALKNVRAQKQVSSIAKTQQQPKKGTKQNCTPRTMRRPSGKLKSGKGKLAQQPKKGTKQNCTPRTMRRPSGKLKSGKGKYDHAVSLD